MSTFLYALGLWSYRHSWRVLIAWLLLLGLGGVGAVTLGQGTDNSFSIPGTESEAGLEDSPVGLAPLRPAVLRGKNPGDGAGERVGRGCARVSGVAR